MHLVCHQTIPGTPYEVGKPVTDVDQIAEINDNPAIKKFFSQVPDGTFPAAAAQKPYQAPTQIQATTSTAASNNTSK